MKIMRKHVLLILMLILGYSTQVLGGIDPILGSIQVSGNSDDLISITFSVRNSSFKPIQYAKVRIISITGAFLGGGETDSNGFYRWDGAEKNMIYFAEVTMIGYESEGGRCVSGYHYTVTFAGDGIIVRPNYAFIEKVIPSFQLLAILNEKIGVKVLFT